MELQNFSDTYTVRLDRGNMMKRLILLLPALIFCLTSNAANAQNTVQPAALRTVAAPVIMGRPVRLTEYRQQLMREYALQHYGEEMTEIVPRAVIVHWTESQDADSVYRYFYKEARKDGTLNVCPVGGLYPFYCVGENVRVYTRTPCWTVTPSVTTGAP